MTTTFRTHLTFRVWHGKSLWCRHCFASHIVDAEAERAK